MDPHIERAIAERASIQLGHLIRPQALAIGCTYTSIAHALRVGRFHAVGSRTLRIAGTPVTPEARIMAACLDLDGVASHRTAAWLHGLEGFGCLGPIEVSVRKGRSATESHLARVHTSTNLVSDDIVTVRGVPATSVARTLFGLAALVSAEVPRARLVGALEAAVRDGRASDSWLWWRLESLRCRGRNGVSVFESVLAERASLGPTESWLERQTLRILCEAGLPRPRLQRVIRRSGRFAARVDFLYEAAGVVLEVKGKWHATPGRIAADEARVNELQLLGFRVLQFGHDSVVRRPSVVTGSVAQALAGRRAV